MNLKKWTRAVLPALLLPILALSGCEEWKADPVLMETLWIEVTKVTGLDPKTPPPQMDFLPGYDPYGKKANGRCCLGNRGEIYLSEEFKDIWIQRGYMDVSYLEGTAIIYGTVGHEMLHYAFFLRGIPTEKHHQMMKDERRLEKLIDVISQHFRIHPKSAHKEIIMKRLEGGVRDDREKLKKGRED